MCHRISSKNIFYRTHDHYLCGIKRFLRKRSGLYPFYERNGKYSISKTNGYYCLATEPTTQNLDMMLPSYPLEENSHVDMDIIDIDIIAGIHIASFPSSSNFFDYAFLISNTEIYLPVLFEVQDVLFFDGVDVSVSRLYLPTYKQMLKILKGNVCVEYKKEFMTKYKEILSLVKKQLSKTRE
ncbi:MAG: hypothetical protein AB1695_12590 [Stygiobacter sp.]